MSHKILIYLLLTLAIFLIIAITTSMFNTVSENKSYKVICESKGGVLIIYNKGSSNVCIKKDSLIEL